MSIHQLSQVVHQLLNFSDILFSGLKILVPFTFLLKIIKTKFIDFDEVRFTNSINILLLSAGLVFSIALLTDVFKYWLYNDEAALDFMLNNITGAHWYQLGLPVIVYALLPQLLWSRELRGKITFSLLIILVWIISDESIIYLNKLEGVIYPDRISHLKQSGIEYLWKTVVSIILIFIIYFLRRRKMPG